MIRSHFTHAAVAVMLAFATSSSRTLPLQIAVEDAADPWSRGDGTGFANDVVRAAFRAMDVDVAFVVVPYARCKDLAIQGDVVACFSMSRDPQLDASIVFPSIPLFVCYSELLQNPGRPLPATALDRLPTGTVVGAVLGYEYPTAVRQAEAAGHIRLELSRSEELLLRKLAAGRVQAAIVNVNESKPLAYLSALASITGGVERVGRVGRLDSHIGFSRKHARGEWARSRYEEGMRRIASSGELARVVRQWADTSATKVRAMRDDHPRGLP